MHTLLRLRRDVRNIKTGAKVPLRRGIRFLDQRQIRSL